MDWFYSIFFMCHRLIDEPAFAFTVEHHLWAVIVVNTGANVFPVSTSQNIHGLTSPDYQVQKLVNII